MPKQRAQTEDGSTKKSRPHGSGSIYPDTKRGGYIVQIRRNGKTIRRRAKTQAEAKSTLRLLQQQYPPGVAPMPELEVEVQKRTIEWLANEWMAYQIYRYETDGIRRATKASYQFDIEHMLPHIGKVPLHDLTEEHLQHLKRELLGKGKTEGYYAPTIVKRILYTTDRMLQFGVDKHYLLSKPQMQQLIRDIHIDETRRSMPLAHIGQLLNYLAGHRLSLLYWMALLYGLRRGELLALTWKHTNLRQQYFIIRSSRKEIEGSCETGKPKTKKSTRKLPLTDWLTEQLCEYRTLQQALAAQTPGWQENGLIFPSDVGTYIRPSNLNRQFRNVQRGLLQPGTALYASLDDHGLSIPDDADDIDWDDVDVSERESDGRYFTFHELRHTHATLSAGLVDESQRSRILGHRAPGVTNGLYTKSRLDLQRIGLELVQQVLLNACEAARRINPACPSDSAATNPPNHRDE